MSETSDCCIKGYTISNQLFCNVIKAMYVDIIVNLDVIETRPSRIFQYKL